MFLVFLILFAQLAILFFLFEFFVLGVVGVGLVEAVSCIGHDHVEELLEDSQFKVLSEVGSVDFVGPEASEDFVDVETVLEF
jgi:hypothetical protein